MKKSEVICIAYIILAHTDPEHIARLANKLTFDTEDAVFIHVDAKVDIAPYKNLLKDYRNVFFVAKRVKAYWAVFSYIEATINSFSQALDTNIFDRFMILQGLDYPICSNLEIHDFFYKYPEKEFIRAVNETSAEDFKDIAKYRFNWYWDKHNRLPFLWNKLNMLFLKFKAPLFTKTPYLQLNGKTFEIYRGWAHFALTRIAVEYIIAFYYNNPIISKKFMLLMSLISTQLSIILIFVGKLWKKAVVRLEIIMLCLILLILSIHLMA